jgi:hypothetical protein
VLAALYGVSGRLPGLRVPTTTYLQLYLSQLLSDGSLEQSTVD